ncbi:ATP-dependent translocase ABCB1-like [Tubulanus polymorphus]|uniref:ATP-dependent translocase ABCB1-like n=1 Tax=Tubulanus polymorphus TaxID=672921 RepID=UPI003DA3DD82
MADNEAFSADAERDDGPQPEPPSYEQSVTIIENGEPRPKYSSAVDDKGGATGDENSPNGIKPLTNGNTPITDEKDKEKTDSEEEVAIRRVGITELFRFADKVDVLLMIVGTVSAVTMGCSFPINLVVYGEVADIFVGDAQTKFVTSTVNVTSPTTTNTLSQVWMLCIFFCVIGLVVLLLGYLSIMCWVLAAERQTERIRSHFFRAILRQDIAWYDLHASGELNTRLADDLPAIQRGIGDKVSTFLQWTTTFIAGFVLGFAKGWKLTLVILAVTPLLALGAAVMARLVQTFSGMELKAYAKAGAVAEEVLGAIRTVQAFGGAEKETNRYSKNLLQAKKVGIRKGAVFGVGAGYLYFIIFGAFALAFWYGAKLVREENFSAGTILMVFFGVLFGAMSLGNALPNIEAFSKAQAAAATIYDIIDLVPEIDSSSTEGTKPNIDGNIEFSDVSFRYPSRPECKILSGFSMDVKVGQTVALVGSSGCGKSTTVNLLQRFYDAEGGSVKIDGVDVRDMNLKWLRNHIGVVSQEPALFATTIAENIRFGGDDGAVTQAEVEQAARNANAHDFIMQLPERYETMVGERGAQLSGGQKQRIAIARALIRNPKILLLDEATSALDTESEAIVQEALEKASKGRTTLVIAHRLSTVQNADLIVAVKDGRVAEQGNHDKLMSERGLYYSLVTSQVTEKSPENDSEDEDSESEVMIVKPASAVGSGLVRRTSSSRHHETFRRRGSLTSSQRSIHSLQRIMSGEQPQPDDEIIEDTKAADKRAAKQVSMTRLLKLNRPEWLFILLGCFSAIITGGVQPAFAIVFSEILGVFAIVDPDKQSERAVFYSLILLGIGIVSGGFYFLQNFMFAISGERLTLRLRQMAFKSILKQEMGWFDNSANQVGALTARLASDTSLVKGATGSRFAIIIQAIANLGVGILISFVYGWKLTLVVLCFLPLMAVAGVMENRMLTGFAKTDNNVIEEGGKIAVEATENIRTVSSLNRQHYFYSKYISFFEALHRQGSRKAHIHGITYSSAQSIIYFAYAVSFAFGAYLVDQGEMVFIDIFKIFGAITFGGMAFGEATTAAPDYFKAKVAAHKLFRLFDRVPEIDSSSTDGLKLNVDSFSGNVRFEKVNFHYPTRPNVRVLRNLDLSLNAGEVLALVGSSGCGKSTTVQLIERFYNPITPHQRNVNASNIDLKPGHVMLDGHDVKDLNIQWLRSRIGIVAQEPVLFATSIRENIEYGENSRVVSMDEIITAARDANIHDFIQSLPLGYETNVGDKGTQLSGGQKQRIAIARALIRNPKILLLDEATSALDTESEAIVQEALDRAQRGRTCIVIAHRLSTIQNANRIAVIHRGVVAEIGTHAELMKHEGAYYKLQRAQNRSK